MKACTLPETVNYHFTSTCNMKCRFCFAGFRDCDQNSLQYHKAVIRAIGEVVSGKPAPCRINFVGGEPTVYPQFQELLFEAKNAGLKTSIVTNGFLLIKHGVPESFRDLDIVGLSVDSVSRDTNLRIGRSVSGATISSAQWVELFAHLKEMGVMVKINTTVTKYNAHEDLSSFITEAGPSRWKVFQGMVVKGQNALNQNEWVINSEVFDDFVKRHQVAGCDPVVESESIMRGSYAMISPDGRFFDSTEGEHTYSAQILDVGIEKSWAKVCFDQGTYDERTSSYSKEEVSHV